MTIAEQYQILNALGNQHKRKFGDVFLVQSKIDGTKAVLKALRKTSKSGNIEARLKAEAQFTFSFPGLPNILELQDSEGEILLLKSYSEGTPLDEYWKGTKKRERWDVLLQLVRGLIPLYEHIHEKGIIHCDIKPSNILVDDQDGFKVHLIDFGLALNTNSFKNRKLVFPLGFAAPELILNQLHIVDPSTDIYALGILIWRLYVGELPLKHANPSIFTNLQLTHPLPSHTKIRKELFTILSKMCVKYNFKMPPNIMPKEEVLKCLNLAQKERYQGLGQVLEDLEKIRIKKTWF